MILWKNDNVVARKIHGAFFFINISDNYSGDKCAIYEVNETAMFIWKNIDGQTSVAELVRRLKQEITEPIADEVLQKDVDAFVKMLLKYNFSEERQL